MSELLAKAITATPKGKTKVEAFTLSQETSELLTKKAEELGLSKSTLANRLLYAALSEE